MSVVSSCSCLCLIRWSQVLSREWRCSWSSTDRRCFNYIWSINSFIASQGVTYIKCLTVYTQLTHTGNIIDMFVDVVWSFVDFVSPSLLPVHHNGEQVYMNHTVAKLIHSLAHSLNSSIWFWWIYSPFFLLFWHVWTARCCHTLS